jgi:uncharacterized membrane protein YbhN (UPF0104 family)
MIVKLINKNSQLILKLGLSFFFLFLLFRTFSVIKLREVLLSLSLWWVLLALGIALLRNAVSALRWQEIMQFQRLRVPFNKAYTAYLESYLFNQFLPTSLGGDLRRGWMVKSKKYSLGEAYSGLLFERIIGQFGLVVIGLIGIFGLSLTELKILSLVSNIILLSLFAGFFVFLLTLPKLLEIMLIRLEIADRAIVYLKNMLNSKLIITIILYSILFQFVTVLGSWSIGQAASIHLPLLFYMGVLPVTSLLSLLPISLNGWGIREGVYYYYLSRVGINAGEAAIVALLFNLPNLFLALVGISSFWRGHEA